jgi:hypothetical protein
VATRPHDDHAQAVAAQRLCALHADEFFAVDDDDGSVKQVDRCRWPRNGPWVLSDARMRKARARIAARKPKLEPFTQPPRHMMKTSPAPKNPESGGQRVQAPDAVNGEEPAIATGDAQSLKRGMKEAAERNAAAPAADSEDTLKRRAARDTPRENDAGA